MKDPPPPRREATRKRTHGGILGLRMLLSAQLFESVGCRVLEYLEYASTFARHQACRLRADGLTKHTVHSPCFLLNLFTRCVSLHRPLLAVMGSHFTPPRRVIRRQQHCKMVSTPSRFGWSNTVPPSLPHSPSLVQHRKHGRHLVRRPRRVGPPQGGLRVGLRGWLPCC